MIRNFVIVELTDQGLSCTECGLMNAFKYMVEDTETGGRWFGSNDRTDCEDYINNF